MISAPDVIALYRCLLNRAPESPDTIAAFQAYYANFAAGRDAVLQSGEFARLFAAETGRSAALIAEAFLRAAPPAMAAPAATPQSAALADMLRRHGAVRLAVVAGSFPEPLTELLPLTDGTALVVHAAPHYRAGLPELHVLSGAAALLGTGAGPDELATILRQAALPIDVLAVHGDPAWFTALQPLLAARAILIAAPDFPAAVEAWEGIERPLRVGDLHVRGNGFWPLPVQYHPRPAAPPPADAPRLAIAAIVRNEQQAVVNMLASVAAIADCFVVLDTGSTDETAERAAAFLQTTGKPWTLRHHKAERFDDMRNAALDLVPPEADWVLMLDADEELAAEDHAPLLTLLRTATHDAYAMPRYNYLGPDKSGDVTPYPDRQVRLLRNTPDHRIRYDGAVHETIRGLPIARLPLDATALSQGDGGPHIHHLVRRFRTPDAEATKQAHYRHLAEVYAGT